MGDREIRNPSLLGPVRRNELRPVMVTLVAEGRIQRNPRRTIPA